MREFQRGQRIRTVSGNFLEVIGKLGQGGQGIVYRVSYMGRELALKWYYPNRSYTNQRFYNNIQNNINHGAPTKSFLWPLELTEHYENSFGYLMELRPPEYIEFTYFLLAYEKFHSIGAIIEAALNITRSFRTLHSKGFSYQDLNDGNFFVNPVTGDVLICDNDNVAPYGENLGVGGKFRYVAPEIVCGRKSPDVHTDRFSLAIILYLLLFFNHPFEGRKAICPCLTEELEMQIYGTEPIFVWDPTNESNRPVVGVHTNSIKIWPLYPKFVRDTFIEAFSRSALLGEDITHRVQEKLWQEVFTEVRNVLVTCDCGEETFYYTREEKNNCIICEKPLRKLPVLKVKRFHVVLQGGKKLNPCHTVYDSEDFDGVTGSIVASNFDRKVLGIKNESESIWLVTFAEGTTQNLEKGQTVKIFDGMKLNFGNGNIGVIE